MTGVMGRLAGSQIGRQIGREALANIGGGGLRQVATQELERLMQNPQIQEAFTREQLRIMMKIRQSRFSNIVEFNVIRGWNR